MRYEIDHGYFPFDVRGSSYALHELRPYFRKLPTFLSKTAWRDDRVLLNDALIHYTNEPPHVVGTQERSHDDTIMWINVDRRGRLCIYRDGGIGYEPTAGLVAPGSDSTKARTSEKTPSNPADKST